MTACHKQGGCIRSYEDDTCGEQGQCDIILAVLAERERCASVAMYGPPGDHDWHPDSVMGTCGKRIAAAIRLDPDDE